MFIYLYLYVYTYIFIHKQIYIYILKKHLSYNKYYTYVNIYACKSIDMEEESKRERERAHNYASLHPSPCVFLSHVDTGL